MYMLKVAVVAQLIFFFLKTGCIWLCAYGIIHGLWLAVFTGEVCMLHSSPGMAAKAFKMFSQTEKLAHVFNRQ